MKKKCHHVMHVLGFDACIDRHDLDFASKLRATVPNGIDIYFENVGGEVTKAVWPLLNNFARVPLCGRVSWYNANESLLPGPDQLPRVFGDILKKRILVQGFVILDHFEEQAQFMKEMSEWVRSGKVRYLEDVVVGLLNAPQALIGLLKGENFGKVVVKVSS